jgi:hypothetical protein
VDGALIGSADFNVFGQLSIGSDSGWTTMKFGVMCGPVFPPFPPYGEMPAPEAFATGIRICEAARDNGFDGLSVPHHYLTGPEAQYFPPLVTAAYLAAKS